MNKKLITSLVVASAAYASAATANHGHHHGHHNNHNSCHPLKGFAFGASIGHDVGASKVRRYHVASPYLADSVNLSTPGLMGQINMSYGFYTNGFYVAPEISGSVSNGAGKSRDNVSATNDTHLRLKRRGSYGAALKVGKPVHGVLPYALVGYENTKYRTTSISQTAPTVVTMSKNAAGLKVGAGITAPCTMHIAFDARYTYTKNDGYKQSHTGTANYAIHNENSAFLAGLVFTL